MPPGYTPIAIYVKGSRKELLPKIDRTFGRAVERDLELNSLMDPPVKLTLDESMVFEIKVPGSSGNRVSNDPPTDGSFQISNTLPTPLQSDTLQGVTIVPYGRVGNAFQDGECKLNTGDLPRGLEATLRVSVFEPGESVMICQVDVSQKNPWRIGERGFDPSQPLRLVDAEGRGYDAIGYWYQDSELLGVRFTPASALTGLIQLPSQLSSSTPGQTCKLIFRVSKGVTIRGLAIGDKLAIKWAPTFKVDGTQMTGR